jgi:hypothetical protein
LLPLDALDVCLEASFALGSIEVTDDHAQDFLHRYLPSCRAGLEFERVVWHGSIVL